MVEASGPKSLALGERGGVRGEDKDRSARLGGRVGGPGELSPVLFTFLDPESGERGAGRHRARGG